MDGLEISPEGAASFVALREPGWHGLGTVVTERKPLAELMTIASLSNWNVRLHNLPDSFPEWNFYRDRNLVIRDNPWTPGQIDVLGDVGGRFTVFSNEDMFQFCENLLHGLGEWETLGSILGGTKVFGCMTMDMEDIVIDPQGANDKVKNYLMCTQAFDGTGSITFGLTPIRIECQNCLNVAMGNLKTRYSIKHTPGQAAKREDAQKILGISLRFNDVFAKEAQKFFETECTNQQFDDLIKAQYPEPELDAAKGAHTKWESKREQLWDLYTGPTNTTIKGTAWGAFNAMTERLDWGRKPRKGDSENVFIAASGMDDVIAAEKTAIWYTVKDVLVDA